MATNNYISDLAIHPGEFLSEVIEDMGMTQLELSQRLGRPTQTINEIIKGKKSITPDTAVELENVLKIPSHIWLGLESEYQMVLAKQKEQKQMEKETNLVKNFPYSDLASSGFVKGTKNMIERVAELKNFFAVSRLSAINGISTYNPAFRVAKDYSNISPEAIASWMQASTIKAKEIKTEPFDKKKLKDSLPQIKGIMAKEDINKSLSLIKDILASCGIAFVWLPNFKKTKIHGATFWVDDGKKAILSMTLRGSYSDIFWFSFFHEVGHILLHKKRDIFLENDVDDTKQEAEANEFSSDFLIPKKEYAIFLKEQDFSADNIKKFAKHIDVLPSVVVGRLMYDKIIEFGDYRLNKLRDRYTWASKLN